MSPEQARGETVDHRADLFSLGSVLYAMCTGRSPFRASTTLGVLKRVCDDTHRPIQEVNPDVPDWLSWIIDRLLAKDRAERYQTADEVVDVLGTQLAHRQRGNGESLEAGPAKQTLAAVEDIGPAKGHQRRRRWPTVLGALIVVLAGLFVITEVSWVKRSLPPIPDFLGLRKPKGLISIHMPHPEFRVFLNGHLLVPDVVLHSREKVSGGYLVDVYRGDIRVTRKWFDLKPGMMVEMEVLKDGSLEFQHDGPVRSPSPRIPGTKTGEEVHKSIDSRIFDPVTESLDIKQTKGRIVVHLSNPKLRVLVNDKLLVPGVGTHSLSTEPRSYGIGYGVDVFKADLKIAREFFYLKPGMMVDLEVLKDGTIIYGYDGPMRWPLPGVKPDIDNRLLGPYGGRIGHRSPWQWQTDQAGIPDNPVTLGETEARERLVDRIDQAIRNDPLAMSLADQIKSTKEDLYNRGVVRRGVVPAATVALQKRLADLSEEYTERVQVISDEIRKHAAGQENLPDVQTPQ